MSASAKGAVEVLTVGPDVERFHHFFQ